ncbi:hypothetical protein RRG08_043938 [Elysia crispata]|uniref:Uncharacterized protein n=1 Tax=Elysia crispata TaxID=231223 RepID=A0AAE0Y0Q6_9GAST|nr:hypothetical protein RRG08_043938 [Elysia crispata]
MSTVYCSAGYSTSADFCRCTQLSVSPSCCPGPLSHTDSLQREERLREAWNHIERYLYRRKTIALRVSTFTLPLYLPLRKTSLSPEEALTVLYFLTHASFIFDKSIPSTYFKCEASPPLKDPSFLIPPFPRDKVAGCDALSSSSETWQLSTVCLLSSVSKQLIKMAVLTNVEVTAFEPARKGNLLAYHIRSLRKLLPVPYVSSESCKYEYKTREWRYGNDPGLIPETWCRCRTRSRLSPDQGEQQLGRGIYSRPGACWGKMFSSDSGGEHSIGI